MDLDWYVKKTKAVLRKGPATARNALFSQFDYWPVRRLRHDAIRTMPIYCISMTSAERRRKIIQRQAEEMGLTALEFVDAVDGSKEDRASLIARGLYDERKAIEVHGRPLNMSEFCGSLSHGLAYDRIVERGHDVAMIIEDDCLFRPAQLERVALHDFPEGWDIVFLNSFVENGPPTRRIKGNLFHGDAWTGSAAAYFVSKKGAQILADGYAPTYNAADGYTGRNDIDRYMVWPDCALNGSVCYYYNSTVDWVRPKKTATRDRMRSA